MTNLNLSHRLSQLFHRAQGSLFLTLVLAVASPQAHPSPQPTTPVVRAQLLNAWWVDGSAGLDISGLSFCHGALLAVADKSSERLYRVAVNNQAASAVLETRAVFSRPPLPDDQPVSVKARALHYASTPLSMDFEGVTCDGEATYLLSERHNRIARLDTGAKQARWLPQRWSESAKAQGYLQRVNAESEGLVKAGEDFWVALERQPRGLLKLQPEDTVGVAFYTLPEVPGLDFRGRAEDLTGLACYDGGLFTLERNAFAVCRRNLHNLRAEWCIHYQHVEEGAEYVYQETRFGKGEGLAINDQGIFVVLDNNGVARAAAPEDARGLLIQLAFPDISELPDVSSET
ncbi:esterase-like activity of phytase family protein [Microbulbifer elongatus]|uniref:esterase-like activity of phytase family protein n=1 Tax=Microbulbifer elongatus TaxID=86173 RepID=UPI001E5DAA4E|nr:esterase-like activity of phytase family protein [Microbulbifer elongatus]